jgi:hypothetical protein
MHRGVRRQPCRRPRSRSGGCGGGGARAPGHDDPQPDGRHLLPLASPEADPFVRVGTRVELDRTLCIIEAMKVMNEIKAEISGECSRSWSRTASRSSSASRSSW